MATNLPLNDELKGILSDVSRKRFRNGRQINPQSNLFQTAKYAVEHGYVEHAQIDENFSTSLALVNLTKATLTKKGQRKLSLLTNLGGKDAATR